MLARNSTYIAGVAPAALLLALFFVGPALWALYSSLTNLALVGIDAAKQYSADLKQAIGADKVIEQ